MSQETSPLWKSAIIPVCGLLLFAAILWAAFSGGGEKQEVDRPELPDLSPAAAERRAQAIELQSDGQWCEARDQWRKFRESIEVDSSFWLPEIDANLKICQQRCEPGDVEMAKVGETIAVEPTAEPISTEPDDLLKYYPADKQVRAIGFMAITGTGSNADWGVLRSSSHFAHESQAVLVQRVLENDGDFVHFELQLPILSQKLLVSDQSLHLELPTGELLDEFYVLLDKRLARTIQWGIAPKYMAIRKTAEIFNQLDPQAESTLSWLAKRLRAAGVELDRDRDMQLVEKIETLAGHTFELIYHRELGMKSITTTAGDALPLQELTNFARRSGVLADFIFSEVLDKEVGETFTVDVEHLSSLLGVGYDVEARGELQMKRTEDQGDLAVMSVIGGEVILEGTVEGTQRKGVLRPKSGEVEYDRQSLFIKSAFVDWHAEVNFVSEDHLLFKATGVKNLDAKSYYRGKLVSDEEQP
ncbi:MAG: hypothetical protein RH917_08315 [Lacipirellulaceae bacterium]